MSSRLRVALPAAILGAAVAVASAPAQMRGGRISAPAPRSGMGSRFGPRPGFPRSGFLRVRQRRSFPGSAFIYPFFYPGYDDYYDYGPSEPPPPLPPPQAAVAESAPPAAPASPAVSPLILEYQGDEWVRVANYDQSPASALSAAPSGREPTSGPRFATAAKNETAAPPSPELPPAVLVFRDGHQEEVQKYTIMGGVIYTGADYWTTGSWTRKVRIAELNIPATLKLNRERGGKLTLPAGPNEIVIRP